MRIILAGFELCVYCHHTPSFWKHKQAKNGTATRVSQDVMTSLNGKDGSSLRPRNPGNAIFTVSITYWS